MRTNDSSKIRVKQEKYQNIWKIAVKYLGMGIKKDYVLHTEGVVMAMKQILQKEKGNPDILIPAAMLHDVGWSRVPKSYQRSNKKNEKLKAMHFHIEYAPEIINKILQSLDYDHAEIEEIVDIVKSHKFCTPKKLNKKLLIDADQLSDAYKKQFNSDIKAYNTTAEKLHNFRIRDNNFYTKTAENIFIKLMKKRKKEIIN